jgi:CHAT domain-containing protein
MGMRRRRALMPVPGPATIRRVSDRAQLRSEAQQLVVKGRLAEASALLETVARLYRDAVAAAWAAGRDVTADLQSLVMIVAHQVRCAAGLGNLDVLVDRLAAAADLHRELTVGSTSAWSRFLTDAERTLGFQTAVLDSLGSSGPPGGAAALDAARPALREATRALARCDPQPPDPETLAGAAAGVVGAFDATAHEIDRIVDMLLEPAVDDDPILRGLTGAIVHQLRQPPGDAVVAAITEQEAEWDVAAAGRPGAVASTASLVRDMACALVGCSTTLRQQVAFLHSLGPADAARRTRDGNRVAMLEMTGHVESWRSALGTDWERIRVMDRAQPFYRTLVRALVDLGLPDAALAASELARARAFSDLLAGRRGPLAGALAPEQLTEVLDAQDGPVVEYFFDGDRLSIFTRSPGSSTVVTDTRVDPALIERSVDRFRDVARGTAPADPAALAAVLRDLGAAVWDPVPLLDIGPDTPVTVVPHGPLLRVPFAALLDVEGRYLVHRHPVTVLPTLAILAELRDRPAGTGAMRILVDPTPMPDGLPALPVLRAGLRRIAERARGPVEFHDGQHATVDALCTTGHRPLRVLCLATHAQAFAKDGDPMRSFLAVAPGDPRAVDGKLTAAAVHELDIEAELVVLAACDTGSGLVTSDGMVGLSRAFLTRRCGGVLMSLARVSEQDTLALLRLFLAQLPTAGPVLALRAAQASLAGHYPDQPHRWAPFTVMSPAHHPQAATRS